MCLPFPVLTASNCFWYIDLDYCHGKFTVSTYSNPNLTGMMLVILVLPRRQMKYWSCLPFSNFAIHQNQYRKRQHQNKLPYNYWQRTWNDDPVINRCKNVCLQSISNLHFEIKPYERDWEMVYLHGVHVTIFYCLYKTNIRPFRCPDSQVRDARLHSTGFGDCLGSQTWRSVIFRKIITPKPVRPILNEHTLFVSFKITTSQVLLSFMSRPFQGARPDQIQMSQDNALIIIIGTHLRQINWT